MTDGVGPGALRDEDLEAWMTPEGEEPDAWIEPHNSPRPRGSAEEVPVARARRAAIPTGASRREPRIRRATAGTDATARRGRRWGGRALALLAFVAIAGSLYAINATFQPFQGGGGEGGAVRVQIPEGANVAQIGTLLEERGVVDSADFFVINATLTGRRANLLAGDYLLRENMTYSDATAALMQGPEVRVVDTFDVTIPEGQSRREIADTLADTPVRGDYLAATAQAGALRRARELGLPRARDTLEGFLFPATYELEAGGRARDLVSRQLDAFQRNFASVDLARAQRRDLSRYDVLIIASMIERETMIDEERELVSAVIHNRLREGMPLGIDATIRYATDNWTRPIRVSELEQDGPYNTRLRQGLPPTPIGNPGLASLEAAANPADVDYLFYVVKPGTCGEHAFSSTDAQFQRDIQRYNQEREARGGRSPTDC